GRVEQLDPANAKPLFRARPLGLEGVKDPWILYEDGLFQMLLSVALPTANTSEKSHATLDIFNTGECVSGTALAVSRDLKNWDWLGVVFTPGEGWDRYCRRVSSIIPGRGKLLKYLAFYDGSADHTENYEEKTGLAFSPDLRRWESLTL